MRNRLGGLPKKTQTFLFFSINSQGVKDFQNRLKIFAPLITTVTDVFNDREKIKESQDDANKKNITAIIIWREVQWKYNHSLKVVIGRTIVSLYRNQIICFAYFFLNVR